MNAYVLPWERAQQSAPYVGKHRAEPVYRPLPWRHVAVIWMVVLAVSALAIVWGAR